MYDTLKNSFIKHVSFSEQEWDMCTSFFRPKHVARRQLLLQEGELCRDLFYVTKGALYSYTTDSKGNQHVIRFAFEGWWMANLKSFFNNSPTRLSIEALENCDLLVIDKEHHFSLMDKLPAYERYHRILLENAYVNLQERIENALGFTAEEKYANLIEQSPQFLNRVPLHLVASYLGISPETLSRVRASGGR